MSQLSRNLVCIRTKSGVEIWAEAERAAKLKAALVELKTHFFVEYDGQVINTAEIEGIFAAATMDGLTRRKNGEWQCQAGTWHGRKQECRCAPPKVCVRCGRSAEGDRVDSSEGPVCGKCWAG